MTSAIAIIQEARALCVAMDRWLLQLVRSVPPPKLVSLPQGPSYRYVEKRASQAMVLLLTKCLSGIRAAALLIEAGHVQESGMVLRTVDENSDTVDFLVFASAESEEPRILRRYLDSFFAEEIAHEQYAAKTKVKGRDIVSRRDIANYLSSHRLSGGDQFSGTNAAMAVHYMLSGFVHGSASHAFDLYDPRIGAFETTGTRSRMLMEDHAYDFVNYIYRTILAFAFASSARDLTDIGEEARQIAEQYAQLHGLL